LLLLISTIKISNKSELIPVKFIESPEDILKPLCGLSVNMLEAELRALPATIFK
jgi:hypothetical protein